MKTQGKTSNLLFLKTISISTRDTPGSGRRPLGQCLWWRLTFTLASAALALCVLSLPLARAQTLPTAPSQAPTLPPAVQAPGPAPAPQPPAGERSSLAQSVAIQQQVEALSRDLVRNSVGVTTDIRRGVDRLSRDCPDAPAGQQPAPDLLTRIDRSRQLGRAAIESAASGLPALRREADAARARTCGFFSFLGKSDNCRAAESLVASLDRLAAVSDQYRDAFESRHALFNDVARLESRSCVRPGFTDRLLQADEFALQPQELGFNGQLERTLGLSRDLLRGLSGTNPAAGGR